MITREPRSQTGACSRRSSKVLRPCWPGQPHPAPDRGMAGAADRGGIPVGHGTDLLGARGVLTLYSLYYNETRTHLGLGKDAPLRRAVQRSGAIVTEPILSGLHHRYLRI